VAKFIEMMKPLELRDTLEVWPDRAREATLKMQERHAKERAEAANRTRT
jgi:hypothetical protein